MPELEPLLEENVEENAETTFKELFDTIHNSIMGHFGVQYTTQNMRDAGADPKNIQQRVIDLISKCATCIKSRKRLAVILSGSLKHTHHGKDTTRETFYNSKFTVRHL